MGVKSGTKAQQAREMMAGVRPARAEQRKPPEVTSAATARSFTSTSLGRHRKPEANQALLPVLAARATTANTDGHHAAAPGGRDTGSQEERAAIASL